MAGSTRRHKAAETRRAADSRRDPGRAARWAPRSPAQSARGWCESRYNPSAYNASGASGLFQFMPRTWAANSVRAGYGGASVFDPVASANTAAYMFSIGQAGQWVCK